METVEYAPGRSADVYGDPAQRTVLMWHGAQVDARETMRPLADHLAGYGVGVVVADWNSRADDRGRADLLASLRFARAASSDDIVLVGWSLGGVAAAGVSIQAQLLDVRVAHTICLAGAFMATEPVSGRPLPADLRAYGVGVPFTLLHGTDDDVIPVAASREFGATLRRHGWPVEVAELPTDHAAIAGAAYGPAADRYSAARDPAALAIAADVAGRIATLATKSNA